MSEFLVITGMSGGGRSEVADHLEDLGWFVIDNLPPSLIPKVAELGRMPGGSIGKVALVVGTGPYHQDVLPALQELRASGTTVRILFLEASTDTLIQRYESTRRRHPLDGTGGLARAIEREREVLAPVKEEADVVVDTTDLNVHELKRRVIDLFAEATDHQLRISLVSFGFKHGLPSDVDVVFDCRFLPNPYWVPALAPLSGLDEAARRYVLDQPLTGPFLRQLTDLFDLLLPAYVAEGKAYLSVAFGCTGGHHRSVAIVEEMAEVLRERRFDPRITHRDIER